MPSCRIHGQYFFASSGCPRCRMSEKQLSDFVEQLQPPAKTPAWLSSLEDTFWLPSAEDSLGEWGAKIGGLLMGILGFIGGFGAGFHDGGLLLALAGGVMGAIAGGLLGAICFGLLGAVIGGLWPLLLLGLLVAAVMWLFGIQ